MGLRVEATKRDLNGELTARAGICCVYLDYDRRPFNQRQSASAFHPAPAILAGALQAKTGEAASACLHRKSAFLVPTQ